MIGSTRPCQFLEYSGQKTYDRYQQSYKIFKIEYLFAPPEMTHFYKERLVFDIIGMVGSVGGTLGMCHSEVFL